VKLPTRIDSFSGSWSFLSNFHPAEVYLDGVKYASIEHAFQASKTLDLKRREKFTYLIKPAAAKKMGRDLPLRPDWEEVKVGIMRELLMQKFSPSIPKRKLLSTFQAELIEGNWWHDTFWGVCDGSGRHWKCPGHEPYGENMLGKLLMEVRKHYGFGHTYGDYKNPTEEVNVPKT
jgi:ribA/ribD-fused uncharacterized protein